MFIFTLSSVYKRKSWAPVFTYCTLSPFFWTRPVYFELFFCLLGDEFGSLGEFLARDKWPVLLNERGRGRIVRLMEAGRQGSFHYFNGNPTSRELGEIWGPGQIVNRLRSTQLSDTRTRIHFIYPSGLEGKDESIKIEWP